MNGKRLNLKSRVFLSYAREDGEEFATRLRKRLLTEQHEIGLWQDRSEIEGGVGWWKQIEAALDQVRFLLIVMTPATMRSEMTRKEWRYARQRGVNVYPIKGCPDAELDYAGLPNWMRKAHFFDLEKEWETFVNYLKSDRRPPRVPFMAPDFPEGFVQRPREFEQLIVQLLEEKGGSPIAVTTALQGAGGYGKTTLAMALCHDDRVIRAFDDGVLWVTLGQNPNLLGELTKLYEALTGDQPDFVDEMQAGLKLREKLENRTCLLVIDDVWQKAHLELFMQGGKEFCARLITTRRLDLVMDAKRVQVDEMTPEESVALLTARLPGERRPRDAQPFRHLAGRLMEWPLLLKLAAGVIRARLELGDTVQGAVDYANRVYDRRGLTCFDPKDAMKRNDAVAKSILATLELLGREEQIRLGELAIFPEDAHVPLRMIEFLWGLDDLDTQDTAKRLADFALLDLDLRGGLVRLHDEIRLYFGRTISDEAALHARLVDRMGTPGQIQDKYCLRWLTWHLGRAGRHAQWRALLLDFEWMQAKLEGADVQSLIADYNGAPFEPCLHLVGDAIRLSAHVLARDRWQLPSQLTGRLIGSVDCNVQAFLKQVNERATLPWLRPLRPNLLPPGGPLIRTLDGHTGSVKAVAITSDACLAISASSDETLRIWNLESGESVRTLRGHSGSVNSVAMMPDGRQIISASYDNTLRVWDLESGRINQILRGHTASVKAVAITPDGRLAISASYDRTLRIWDLESGATVRTLEGHNQRVNAVFVSPDGCRAVSASYDRTLRLWDLESGKTVRTFRGHTWSISAVAITQDGRLAVSASDDKTLRVWNLESGENVRTFRCPNIWMNALAVTPDGRLAISGSSDSTVWLWDLESGQTARTLVGHTESVSAVAITSDGRLAVSASDDKTLRVWNLEAGQIPPRLLSHPREVNAVTAIAITPDGLRAISACYYRTLRIWDVESGQNVRTLEGHGQRANAVAVTSDGHRAVSASDDKTVRVWDLESGENVRTLQGHSWSVNAVAITPDGCFAVSASDDFTLRVWDLASGKTVQTLLGHRGPVRAVAVTPDGRFAVSGSYDSTLWLWGLESGLRVRTLIGHSQNVSAVAITSDGQLAVSASYDNTLRVWNLESGQTVRTLKGHTGAVRAVAVTPNGRQAVSASYDCTLRVWDLENGAERASLTGDAKMLCCAVAQHDRKIIAGDEAGTLHVLKLEGIAFGKGSIARHSGEQGSIA
jgi:WD40 repeat protein